jgi:hypothetical protein
VTYIIQNRGGGGSSGYVSAGFWAGDKPSLSEVVLKVCDRFDRWSFIAPASKQAGASCLSTQGPRLKNVTYVLGWRIKGRISVHLSLHRVLYFEITHTLPHILLDCSL